MSVTLSQPTPLLSAMKNSAAIAGLTLGLVLEEEFELTSVLDVACRNPRDVGNKRAFHPGRSRGAPIEQPTRRNMVTSTKYRVYPCSRYQVPGRDIHGV